MKKVLMVMGFALCASVAFAQTAHISAKDNVRKNEKAAVNPTKSAVDYKASVFSKANGHDTIQVFKMDVASDYTFGTIAANDRINDTLVGNANAHNVPGAKNSWQRANSCAWFLQNGSTFVPGLTGWLGAARLTWITEDVDPALSPREPEDDGFMFFSYWETSQSSGIINAYFTLPVVARPSNAAMIEVSLTQCYRKYYDRCYIDYKVGNQWWAREINVDGIDMGVNNWAANKVRYVMPHRLNSESNIELRVRAYSYHRGNVFGYFWAVDNVAVMALTLTEYWALNSPTKIDGFYGMVPQGMVIPMTYGINAQNLSTDNITNAKVTVNAGSSRNSLSQILQGPAVNVTAGNFDTVFPLLVNERGFFVEGEDVTSGYQSWPYDGTNTSYGQNHLNAGFQGRGLPAATTGKNFYSINVSGGSLSRTYDTILYYVTENRQVTNGENGYRWSHDNGIIPAGAFFGTAFTDQDAQGNAYVTDDGFDAENGAHASMAGYGVFTRFITGNDIPEGWVFRGLELIGATDRDVSDMEGASIVPITYKDDYDAESGYLYYRSLPCGIDGMAFEVSENDFNSQLYTDGGFLTPANYKAINITFAEQPVLEPNTSYRFGYRLNDDSYFALAGTRSSFWYPSVDTDAFVNLGFGYGTRATDTIAAYANAAAGANDYRFIPTPGTYMEVIVNDPVEGRSIYAWNIDNYPMIRPIVGPARPVELVTIEGDCTNNVIGQGDNQDHGVMISRGETEFCNGFIQVAAGSQQRIDFEPMGDHSVIDSVLLNGVALQPYNEEQGIDGYMTGEANVYQDPEHPRDDQILLARDFWVYYMSPEMLVAGAEPVFTVYSHWEEWDIPVSGIDPIAPEVSMNLAPNPATSSVKLNVKGVTGMVNCSILDMSGRVIYNANINAESEHMINVSNMPAGAYFVRVTNDTFSKIEKLIIK